MFCPRCATANDLNALACTHCGESLTACTDLDALAKCYSAVIGPKNRRYYLRRFTQFDAEEKTKDTWNWSAFFVTFYWFLYRKMWLSALLYFLLPLITLGLLLLVSPGIPPSARTSTSSLVYLLYLVCIYILPGMYADTLYYHHCRKKIKQVQSSARNGQEQLDELARQGGVNNAIPFSFSLLFCSVSLGIFISVGIPQYQKFSANAPLSVVVENMNKASLVANQYFQKHHQFPPNLAAAGYTAALPASIRTMEIEESTGIITAIVNAPGLRGRSLLMMPTVTNNSPLLWKCLSQEIEDKFLPSSCRQ